MSQRDLEFQIQQLLDGRLSDEDERELAIVLREDEEVREVYCQYAVVDSALNRLTEGKMALTEEDSIAAMAEKRSRFRSARVTWIAAAAIIALSLVALRLIFVTDEPPVLTLRAAEDTVYEVTHADSATDPAPGTLAIGSRLHITQGTMELTFSSGVTSIVQAPVELTLHAEDQIYLDEGIAWFRVPPEARGFRVDTPELEIVDLGTEFGVLASPDSSDEIHVFRGTVQARSRNPLRGESTLTASQARFSDPGGRLRETPARPRDFLTSLPGNLPHLYFSFDTETNRELEVGGSHPAASQIKARLASSDSSARLVPGVSGKALSLDGLRDHVDTDWPGLSGNTPRSVAFWLRVQEDMEPARSLPALVGWGDPTNGINSKWKIHVSRQNEEGSLLPRISFGSERFDGTTALDDGRWHHLVAVYSGRKLDSGLPDVAIYLDGQREKLTRTFGPSGPPARPQEIRTLINSDHAQPLRIGAGVVNFPVSFEGQIDELYIYVGALSEATIQTLFNAPRS